MPEAAPTDVEEADDATKNLPVIATDAEFVVLDAGAYLFRTGERRDHSFKICRGSVALALPRTDGLGATVRIASAGEYIGLGWLDEHTETARAIGPCVAQIVMPEALLALAAMDETLRSELSDAVERDFEARKQTMTEHRPTPLICVAAFLVAISRQNRYEGRDPLVITDSLACGLVAELLRMNICELAQSLLQLKNRGIIADAADDKILIRDIGALALIADSEPD